MVSFHRIIVTCMIAIVMHAPIPVFDGDTLRSGELPVNQVTSSNSCDVDFILLGCDPPDDSDDGPIDDDPENGSGSAFGLPFAPQKTTSQCISNLGCHQNFLFWTKVATVVAGTSRPQVEGVVVPHFSFGKQCQSGTAHQRC